MTTQPGNPAVIASETVTVELVIPQGSTFPFGFTWRMDDPDTPGTPGDPMDLTGATAQMQIRKKQGTDKLVDISSEDPEPSIVLGGVNTGHVAVKLTDEQTDAISVKKALFDLEIQMPNGDRWRVLEGPVTTTPNITQVGTEPVLTA